MSEHAIDRYALSCPCRCHLGGAYPVCDNPEGCADQHDTTPGCQAPECGVPLPPGILLCTTHTQRLAADLAGLADLYPELGVQVARLNRARPQPGGRSSETPLIYNAHASGVRVDVETTISAWCLDVSRVCGEDERDPLTGVDPHDHAGTAAWLHRNLDRLRRHPEAGQAFDEITNAVTEGWRAVDIPHDRIVLGVCRGELHDETGEPTGAECDAVIYGQPGRDTARCRHCDAVHVVAERREWMLRALPDASVTTGQLSRLVDHLGFAVGASTVRGWAQAGRLTCVGYDGHGRALYKAGQAVALMLGLLGDEDPAQPAGAA